MSIRARLATLEDAARRRPCSHCAGAPLLGVHFDAEGEPVPPCPKCPVCGREGLQIIFHVAPEADEAGQELPNE